jgi:hypothetical protein
VDREGVVVRRRVALVEVVDELLDADAGRIRQVAVVDEAAGDGVGGGVDVEAERGFVVDAGIDERVLAGVGERDAVVGRGGGFGERCACRLAAVRRRQVVLRWRHEPGRARSSGLGGG